ncbi:MAG: hypothetical protein HRT72_02740 [Flavobacteriales bacterium]|nr:hypothetical protein [Flavobacteriales bacterium]
MAKSGNRFNNEFEQIHELMADLNVKFARDPTLKYVLKDEYDDLFEQFIMLDTSIYNHKKLEIDSNDRLDMLTDAMASVADLDFSKELVVGGEMDHLDYMALSYNLMRERLEEKFLVSQGKEIINSFQDLYLIVDVNGNVVDSNTALQRKFNLAHNDVVDKPIKSFFEMKAINNNFGIDYNVRQSGFGISRKYIPNTDARFVLKVTNGSFTFDRGEKDGYWYKVESHSTLLYNQKTIKNREYILASLDRLHAQIKRNINKTEDRQRILVEIKEIKKDVKALGGFQSRILEKLDVLLNEE